MVTKKPSIFIYVNNAREQYLKEICAGMEEEGVLFELFSMESGSADELAWRAANDSMMGTGVGVDAARAVLQMKGLRPGKNVEAYVNPTKEQCRTLGANSARSIKKMAFK